MFVLRTLIWMLLCVSSLAQAAPPSGWELVGNKDGVEVARKTMEGSSLFAFRGESTQNVHISILASVLLNDAIGPEWVDLMIDSRLLHRDSDTTKVIYQSYGLPWPIQDRDYVLHQEANYDANTETFTLMFKSVDDAMMPGQECCVRAIAYRTFWRLQALGGNRTQVEVEVYTDPRGSLPAWLINLIQKDWPYNTITALIARANEGDITGDVRMSDW